jgi:tRNA threonylcarbamoyladenosine biosynthesis protein TsaE
MLMDLTAPIESHSVEETIEAGYELGKKLRLGDVVCLEGDLGAGKTHFVKGVASYFGVDPESVSSPTYTLIHEYSGELPVYHFDCYRLKNVREAFEIGAEEYFYGEGVCLIEWPGIIDSLIPEEAIRVDISHVSDSKRSIHIHQKQHE